MGGVGTLTAVGLKVGLAVLLALGATAAARYLQQTRHAWRPRRSALRVVETAPLAQNRALHLVNIGQRTLLLGSTPGQVALLADVTGEQEVTPPEAPGPRLAFASVLSRLIPSQARPATDAAGGLRAAAEALRNGRTGAAR
jgi:flagellar biogenesis protein FliO